MSVVAESVGLSSLDVKAMKQADRVCFDHGRSTEKRGKIRCIREVRNPGPFDDRDKTYAISVESSVFAYDPKDDGRGRHVCDSVNCFELLHSVSPDSSVWTAVCALVRPGDVLRLHWVADSCNGYMKDVNRAASQILHYDTLSLQVKRGDAVIYTLPIAASHCPNNSARMIRGL